MAVDFDAKIMLVDDSPATLIALEKSIRHFGFDSFVYQDAQAALDMANIILPDMIIVDINMPNMNGFEFCQEIKKNRLLQDCAIIFLSASSELRQIQRAFDVGAVDYINKPFLLQDLHARIMTHLKLKKRVDTLNDLLKNSFHELYSPLGVIESSISIMEAKNGRSPYLDRIELAVRSLQSTYKDIYFSLKNDGMEDNKQYINITEYLQQQTTMFELLANAKEMTIDFKAKQKDLTVLLPEPAIERIISNTISNAIKYGKTKSTIDIFAYQKENYTCFDITHLGLLKESMDSVFKRHFQESSNSLGLGLGLDIVKTICSKYSIKIEVLTSESSTTFRYSIPNSCKGYHYVNKPS